MTRLATAVLLVLASLGGGCAHTLSRSPLVDVLREPGLEPTLDASPDAAPVPEPGPGPGPDAAASRPPSNEPQPSRPDPGEPVGPGAPTPRAAGADGGPGKEPSADEPTRGEPTGEALAEDPSRPASYTVIQIPLPIVATDPNTGIQLGVLPATVIRERERITLISAPSITWNELEGLRFDARFRRYFDRTSTLLFDAGASSEGALDVHLNFRDDSCLNDWVVLAADGQILHELTNRFYGFGNDSERLEQTTYKNLERRASLLLGLRLQRWLRVTFSTIARSNVVRAGDVEGLFPTPLRFPDTPGTRGRATLVSHRVDLVIDTRDSDSAPSEGFMVDVFYEVSDEELGSDFFIQRFGIDAVVLIPHFEKLLTTAVGFTARVVDGRDLPFWARTSIGGKTTLRAYGEGRFIDDSGFALNFEERLRAAEFVLFDVLCQLQLAAFAGAGRVFAHDEELTLDDLHSAYGGAVRLVVPESELVASIDLGVGPEGEAVFVGLDYPF